jgi:hypothetical protein
MGLLPTGKTVHRKRADSMINAPHAPAHKKATPTSSNALASADKDGELRPRQLSASDLS